MGGVRMGVEGRGGGARVGRAVASGGVRGRGAKGLCGVAYRWWHIGGIYVGWHMCSYLGHVATQDLLQ